MTQNEPVTNGGETHLRGIDKHGIDKRRRVALLSAVALTAVAGCALLAEPEGPPRKENVFAVTQSNRLISFNSGQPARLLGNRPLAGLKPA